MLPDAAGRDEDRVRLDLRARGQRRHEHARRPARRARASARGGAERRASSSPSASARPSRASRNGSSAGRASIRCTSDARAPRTSRRTRNRSRHRPITASASGDGRSAGCVGVVDLLVRRTGCPPAGTATEPVASRTNSAVQATHRRSGCCDRDLVSARRGAPSLGSARSCAGPGSRGSASVSRSRPRSCARSDVATVTSGSTVDVHRRTGRAAGSRRGRAPASRSVFDGNVPVWTAAPPGSGSRSMRATRLPKYAAWAAPFSPAGPPPITTRSKRSVTPRD